MAQSPFPDSALETLSNAPHDILQPKRTGDSRSHRVIGARDLNRNRCDDFGWAIHHRLGSQGQIGTGTVLISTEVSATVTPINAWPSGLELASVGFTPR